LTVVIPIGSSPIHADNSKKATTPIRMLARGSHMNFFQIRQVLCFLMDRFTHAVITSAIICVICG
jgi:hypothetical protein